MKNENTKSWAHAYMCQVNTTIERRRVSVSVGTCMLPLFVCFFSRALPRNYTTSYIQYVPGSRRFKAISVSPCYLIGGGFLSFGRASYYITTLLLLQQQQHSKHRYKEFHSRQSAKRVKPQESARYMYTVGTGTCNLASNLHDKYPR